MPITVPLPYPLTHLQDHFVAVVHSQQPGRMLLQHPTAHTKGAPQLQHTIAGLHLGAREAPKVNCAVHQQHQALLLLLLRVLLLLVVVVVVLLPAVLLLLCWCCGWLLIQVQLLHCLLQVQLLLACCSSCLWVLLLLLRLGCRALLLLQRMLLLVHWQQPVRAHVGCGAAAAETDEVPACKGAVFRYSLWSGQHHCTASAVL